MTTVVQKERRDIRQEIALIPVWAFVLAAIVFVTVPSIFFGFVWPNEDQQPGPIFRLVIPFLPAIFLAFLVLMIGYVNRDAERRGMSRTLWTLLVIFIPNAIGFILYFLMRSPVQGLCPKCGTVVDPRVNYCPSCRYSFHPTCSQCKAAVRPADTFCANCGAQLTPS
jgi:double zinc ribbon protein/phospholipase D-like protein